ncbi:MarR family transcriptional regulator [Bosea sp. LjRoot9]|uniref:MarR family winged helix-turn-helix transcriptional regulator n=1 Tax=Bosea sp. LjRoot9 TaxID=3342341 RepID=UPI003ECF72F5
MSIDCYCTVLRSATRRMAAFYDEAMAPLGINIAQFSLLRSIARLEPVILTELGRRMELDRSTIGRNVRVLERMGLVKLGSGKDRREATVTLTEAGRRVLQEAAPLWETAQAALEARMGVKATQELREILNRI